MGSEQFFEQISNHLSQNLPFVAYRKPNEKVVNGILQTDNVLYVTNDYTESGFVFAPFDHRKPSYLIPLAHAEVISTSIEANLDQNQDLKEQYPSFKQDSSNTQTDRQSHIKRVQDGVDAIKSGYFSKVVLSRRERVEIAMAIDAVVIFKRLMHRYLTAFVYIWHHPKVGLWLGATPETLLNVKGNRFETMALAGTQAFEGKTDVVWEEKEKEEQQIVTDFIVEQLRKSLGPELLLNSNLKVGRPKTVQAGNLLHLLTEISLHLTPETKQLKPIIEALHPTPAVCGYPKEKSQTYIMDHEDYAREFYSGFMGELHFKETINRNTNRRNIENNAYRIQKSTTQLYVNLRCMQIKGQDVFIYIGGGITADSDPEAEWLETVHKSKVIKSVL